MRERSPSADMGNSLKSDVGFALDFIKSIKLVADDKRELTPNL